MTKSTAILAIITLMVATNTQAKVYKWTDENGQTHYSDKKPEDTQTSEVNIAKAPKNTSSNDASSSDEDKISTQDKLNEYASRARDKRQSHHRKRKRCNEEKRTLKRLQESTISNRKNLDTRAYRYRSEAEKYWERNSKQEDIDDQQRHVDEACSFK